MWNPPPTVTEHNGEPLAPDLEFFVAPPAEIGTVRSAHTWLKTTDRAKSTPVRAAIAVAWGVGGFLLAMGFHWLTGLLIIPSSLTGTPPALWAAIFSLLPAYLGWRASAFNYTCNFVGNGGCAQFRCQGDRATIVQKSMLLFQGVSGVATRFNRSSRNGQYQNTRFYFDWFSLETGKSVFDITGMHHSDSKTPLAQNIYNFARAAESAWYDYLAPRIDAELARQGFVKFYMGSSRWAVLGRGFIRIMDSEGKDSRCVAEDIGSAKLKEGYLTIRRKDAKSSLFDLFNHEGIFGFNYAAMHNARLFLHLFERFLGVRVQ
jgi:hypothetical protein